MPPAASLAAPLAPPAPVAPPDGCRSCSCSCGCRLCGWPCWRERLAGEACQSCCLPAWPPRGSPSWMPACPPPCSAAPACCCRVAHAADQGGSSGGSSGSCSSSGGGAAGRPQPHPVCGEPARLCQRGHGGHALPAVHRVQGGAPAADSCTTCPGRCPDCACMPGCMLPASAGACRPACMHACAAACLPAHTASTPALQPAWPPVHSLAPTHPLPPRQSRPPPQSWPAVPSLQVRMVPARPGIAFVEYEDAPQAGVAMQGLQGFKLATGGWVGGWAPPLAPAQLHPPPPLLLSAAAAACWGARSACDLA